MITQSDNMPDDFQKPSDPPVRSTECSAASDREEATEAAGAWCQITDEEGRNHAIYCYRAGYLKAMRITPPLRWWREMWQRVRAMPDNPSTELALIQLLSRQLEIFREMADRIARFEHHSQIQHHQIMTALETLTASVATATAGQADLTTAVNAAIVRLGNPGATDAQLLTLASAIDGLSASDVSLTAALNAALNPPPPTP